MTTGITKIGGEWYAFGIEDNSVLSIGKDCPKRHLYFADASEGGVKYVATPSPTRQAAVSKARRGGEYSGEYNF